MTTKYRLYDPGIYIKDDRPFGAKKVWAGKLTSEEKLNASLAKYGLSLETYYSMKADQGGVCKICSLVPPKRLEVDHDHKTNKVRGLLCGHCNKMLGNAKDNQTTLLRAIQYLKGNLG